MPTKKLLLSALLLTATTVHAEDALQNCFVKANNLVAIRACEKLSDTATQNCYNVAGSQLSITECSKNDADAKDDALNATYRLIQQQSKGNAVFLKKLKTTQELWIKFRDAQLDALYPDTSNMGSSFAGCYNSSYSNMTQQRTKELQKLWLAPKKEGDVCS